MPEFMELAGHKRLKVGTYIGEFSSPGIGRILQNAGAEFAFVDMEHSGFGYETAAALLRHLHDAGIATVLRPPSQQPHHLSRACDIGAQGIIPAMMGTVEQARACLDAIKYPPAGLRGCALGLAHDDYRPQPVAEALEAANRKVGLVALIETAEGVENSDAIAALEGVECLWIGHLDLSASLGIPGQFDNPLFTDAVAIVMAAAKRHGKNVGRLVSSPEEGEKLFAQGCDFICYLGDIWLLGKALGDGLTAIRGKIGATAQAGG